MISKGHSLGKPLPEKMWGG